MYKYDLHVHTSETSPCATMDGASQARAYKAAGYAGIIITDHLMIKESHYEENYDWKELIHEHFAGYRAAKAEGDKIGLDVFPSMEIGLWKHRAELIAYGVDLPFYSENLWLKKLDIYEFKDLVHKEGGLVFRPHPYRSPNPDVELLRLVDGLEVYNGNPKTDNESAVEFAAKHNLLRSSGSDAHHKEDVGLGGIEVETPIKNVKEFADVLRSGNFKLLGFD